MEKIQELPHNVGRESASSIVHIRKFLTLSIGIVMVVVGLGVAVFASIDELATLVPFDVEQSLSRPYVSALPVPSPDAKVMEEYLQTLGEKLLLIQKLPAGMWVKLHYVDEDEVTAFSTVGGHIFVFRGMLEKLPHENALVMLLAHEIAHVKYRHPLKGLGKGVVASLMLSMMFGTAYSDTVDKVFHDAGLLTVLKFSQRQEILADEEAMHIYYRYYQHRNGMFDLYRVVEDNHRQQMSGSSTAAGIQSGIASRIKNIKQRYEKEMLNDQHALIPFPAHIAAQLSPQLHAGNAL